MFFSDAPHPQPPRFAVQFERGRPEHFGQFSGRQPAQHIHLPQAILRGREALQENRVFPVTRP